METPPRFAARSAYVAQDEALLLMLPGLSWLTPFLVSLLLCTGLALTPAQTKAAYVATELASLPVGSSRVVRAANDAGEIVGTVGQRGFLLNDGGLQEIAGLPGSTFGSVDGPLAAGASVTLGTSPNGGPFTIPPGTHTITALVDDVNRFGESPTTSFPSRLRLMEPTPKPP